MQNLTADVMQLADMFPRFPFPGKGNLREEDVSLTVRGSCRRASLRSLDLVEMQHTVTVSNQKKAGLSNAT